MTTQIAKTSAAVTPRPSVTVYKDLFKKLFEPKHPIAFELLEEAESYGIDEYQTGVFLGKADALEGWPMPDQAERDGLVWGAEDGDRWDGYLDGYVSNAS